MAVAKPVIPKGDRDEVRLMERSMVDLAVREVRRYQRPEELAHVVRWAYEPSRFAGQSLGWYQSKVGYRGAVVKAVRAEAERFGIGLKQGVRGFGCGGTIVGSTASMATYTLLYLEDVMRVVFDSNDLVEFAASVAPAGTPEEYHRYLVDEAVEGVFVDKGTTPEEHQNDLQVEIRASSTTSTLRKWFFLRHFVARNVDTHISGGVVIYGYRHGYELGGEYQGDAANWEINYDGEYLRVPGIQPVPVMECREVSLYDISKILIRILEVKFEKWLASL